MTAEIIQRQAARAILLSPERDVLLLRLLPPGGTPCWVTPGGGLEPGEDIEAGLRRELREEVGLEGFAMGPLLWRRRFHFTRGGRRYCQNEQYFAIQVPRFIAAMSDEIEARSLHSFRWWPAADLASVGERVAPQSLAAIVSRYLSEGAPREIPEVEVIPD